VISVYEAARYGLTVLIIGVLGGGLMYEILQPLAKVLGYFYLDYVPTGLAMLVLVLASYPITLVLNVRINWLPLTIISFFTLLIAYAATIFIFIQMLPTFPEIGHRGNIELFFGAVSSIGSISTICRVCL
jgi:hypothetical protein